MQNIDSYTSIAEDAIKNIPLPKEPKGLYQPIRYALDGGGKRLRPVLAMASAEAFGADISRVINQAVGLELFHNFTLIHDDVMDNADMRRGRPAVHRRWDERTAILSGDAMLTLATMMVAKCAADVLNPSLSLFNKMAMEVYEGQQLDMDFEDEGNTTVDEYLEMIRLKTSVLLGASCAMGAVAAKASPQQVEAIYAYGEKLGIAFQLQDDYLDTFGDPMVFGKEIGGDIVNDKKTWLRIMAAQLDESGVIQEETKHPSSDHIKIDRIRQVYLDLNLPQMCRRLIADNIAEAIAKLKECGLDADAEKFFVDLANKTASRTH